MKINHEKITELLMDLELTKSKIYDATVAMRDAYEAQQARLAEAEECIRFYADQKNHKIYVDPQGIGYPMSVVEYEKGEEAQAYLAKYCEDLSGEK